LLRYNQQGSLTLAKTWGGPALEQAHGIAVRDSFVYIVGETASFGAGLEDAFLLKIDADGGNTIPEFGSIITLTLLVMLTTVFILGKSLGEKRAHLKTT
jgi:hypothetical protein